MSLLEDITDGLRGDDDRTRTDDGDEIGTSVESDGATSSGDGTRTGGTAASTEPDGGRSRDDEHVCSFCRTAFDAERGVCPECDAEIVRRGAR